MNLTLLERLQQSSILVSDGAWGTLLQEKGLQPGECPEYWNILHPDRVQAVAQSYQEAGSDLIETNSFGANRFKLSHYGLENQSIEINLKAAQLTRSVVDTNQLVLGSLGPTGKLLIMGEVQPDELYSAFREQAQALQEGGADALCIETMTDLEEATIAVKAAKENTNLSVMCTMTFDKTITNEFKTMMGISPEQMVDQLIDAGVDVVGTNCGNGMENMIPIVKAIRMKHALIPILVHANAGLPKLIDGKNIFDETPDITASYVPSLIDAGVNIIGGCCGTTPSHIKKIKQIIEQQNPN